MKAKHSIAALAVLALALASTISVQPTRPAASTPSSSLGPSEMAERRFTSAPSRPSSGHADRQLPPDDDMLLSYAGVYRPSNSNVGFA